VTADPQIRVTPTLTEHEAQAVRALVASARAVDGVGALSEASRLALQASADSERSHVLGYAADGALSGYAQIDPAGVAELVVAPAARRRGLGRALLSAVLDPLEGPAGASTATAVWAHGALPAARRLAASAGLEASRKLHLMARPLTPEDARPVGPPEGFRVETFADRQDVDEWVHLNAAAFSGHPEQGRLTRDDFAARAAEGWFDPAGLLYLVDVSAPEGAPPAAFHWTKIDPESAGPGVGEVYVVGVHPAHQGRGLSGPLTRLGLAHLAAKGCTEVVLYVDGENDRALATYRATGFADRQVDLLFVR
jgi:mycothiol synthase